MIDYLVFGSIVFVIVDCIAFCIIRLRLDSCPLWSIVVPGGGLLLLWLKRGE